MIETIIILSITLTWILTLIAPHLSILSTIVHSIEELIGDGGPLWKYFGRLTKSNISDKLGLPLFSILLPISLMVLSVFAYDLIDIHPNIQVLLLGTLVGVRLGDTLFSHWLPVCLYDNKNPGIFTTILYILEVIGIILIWNFTTEFPDLNLRRWYFQIGFLAGVGFFAAVLPTLWTVGKTQNYVKK